MKLRNAIGALLAACVLVQFAMAGIVSLLPAKDNTLIQQSDPTMQRSNGLGDLFSGRTNQNPATISIRRSLMYFDIASAVPANVTITDVSLTMRDVMGLNGDRLTTLHRTLQDWGEGTSFQSGGQGAPATQNDATWLFTFYNAANPTLSPQWNTPGGDFDPQASGSTTILEGNPNGPWYTWSGPGMVADVQSWLDDPTANFGWLIRGDESQGQTAKRLDGRTDVVQSGTIPNPDAPVLTISYVPEPQTLVLFLIAAGLSLVRRGRRDD